MESNEYARIRAMIGSQKEVARMLGVRREVVCRREAITGIITREAALAIRALAFLPEEDLEPVESEAAKKAKRVSVLEILIQQAKEEAREAKRHELLMCRDLLGRRGVCAAVRGPSPASPRWDFWIKAKGRAKQATETVATLVRAARSMEEAGGGSRATG